MSLREMNQMMLICTYNPADKETAIVLLIKIRNYVNVLVGTCTVVLLTFPQNLHREKLLKGSRSAYLLLTEDYRVP